jgi:signal transduction histidine kinase/dsRNA-specific ribonuclease
LRLASLEPIEAGQVGDPTLIVNAALARDALAGVFAALGLRAAYVTTQGPTAEWVRARALADAVQALAGVCLLDGHPLGLISRNIDQFDRLLSKRVPELSIRPALDLYDPKTRLQQVLGALQLQPSYTLAETVGPPHEARHAVRLRITSPFGHNFVVKSPRAASRREAEQRLAAAAIRALELPESLTLETGAGRLVAFVLTEGGRALSEGSIRPTGLLDQKVGPLPLRMDAKWFECERWMRVMDAVVDPETARSWITAIASASAAADRLIPASMAKSILAISSIVAEFKATATPDPDVLARLWDRLLIAATVARLRAIPREVRRIAELADDLQLILRRRGISVIQEADDGVVVERPGELLALLDCLTANGGAREVVLQGASETENALRIKIGAPTPAAHAADAARALFEQLASDWPAGNLGLDGQQASITVLRNPCQPFIDLISPGGTLPDELATSLHDLKNALAAFQSAMTKAAEITGTEELRIRYDASVHLRRARQICAQLLVRSGSAQPPELQELDLASLLDAYSASLLQRRPRSIAVYVAPVPPLTVRTDPDLLIGCLDNLVKNAFEAMPDGGELRLELLDSDGDQFKVSVIDTGGGVSDDQLTAIANQTATRSTKDNGTGLGLVTVTATLRRLGGRLEVSSASGGTTFSIVLPKGTS